MKLNRGIATALLLGLTIAGLPACEQEGPAERAGQAVDDAAQNAGESVKKAGEELKDAVK